MEAHCSTQDGNAESKSIRAATLRKPKGYVARLGILEMHYLRETRRRTTPYCRARRGMRYVKAHIANDWRTWADMGLGLRISTWAWKARSWTLSGRLWRCETPKRRTSREKMWPMLGRSGRPWLAAPPRNFSLCANQSAPSGVRGFSGHPPPRARPAHADAKLHPCSRCPGRLATSASAFVPPTHQPHHPPSPILLSIVTPSTYPLPTSLLHDAHSDGGEHIGTSIARCTAMGTWQLGRALLPADHSVKLIDISAGSKPLRLRQISI